MKSSYYIFLLYFKKLFVIQFNTILFLVHKIK